MKTLQISKFQIAILVSFVVLCTEVITLQYASGDEPCKMGQYVHYGPSRQSVPCYLVSSSSNPTLEDQFGYPNQTKIAYNGSILILNQTISKPTYKVGENITVNTELINIGSKTVEIKYCKPLVVFEIKNETGYEVWPNSQLACVPELTGKKTLHPGEHITISPWGESVIPRYAVPTPSMNNSGKYTVISVALFNFNTTYDLMTYHPIVLWSEPLQITVLPKNYAQSANSTILKNTNEPSKPADSCDKKISDERDSILNSIDKQKAILLAEDDKDFQGLVGGSKYIVGEPSVGGNIDYKKCNLIDPNIQIQFNVLTPNSNLGNCPYVIVLENSSASKILAVDLGSCSALSAPPQNPLDVSQTQTVIVVGGIVGMTAVGMSVFIIMKKK